MSSSPPLLRVALLSAALAACGGGDDDSPGLDGGGSVVRPETTITAAPPPLTNQRLARFELASDLPGATFECTISGRASEPCASPFEVTLPDGNHRLSVVAISAQAMRDQSPAVHEWHIDTVAPDTVLVEYPAAVDNSLTARFGFATSDGFSARFECQLDGGDFAACESPHTTATLAEGPHAFVVRATDEAGNVEVDLDRFTWIVDQAPPDTTLDSGPEGVVAARTATFTFSSPDAAAASTFRCRHDGQSWFECTSPHEWTAVTDGGHTFEVRVVEPLGATDPSPATRSWSVDATAPLATINTGPQGPTGDRTPTFGFVVGSDAIAVECRVTTTTTPAFVPCVSPYTSPELPDGAAVFELRAADALGNARIESRAFTVDTTPPTLAFLTTPAAIGNDNTPSFTWNVEGATTVSCAHSTGLPWSCGTSWGAGTSLPDGSRTFTVTARDAVNNASTIVFSYTIDTVAPQLSLGWGAPSTTGDATPSFPFSSSEPTQCRMDSLPFAACTSPYTAPALSDGNHVLSLRATDAAGNVRNVSHNVWVDTRPLTVIIDTGPTGPTSDRTPSFTWTTTGAVVSTQCRYDADEHASCTTVMDQTLADGPHTFEVRVRNDLNQSFSATQSFTVDTVAPGVELTAGPSGTITTSAVSFSFTTSGAPTVTECRLYRQGQPTGAYAPCGSPHAEELAPPSTPYPYVFEVRVRDAAGNQWSAYRSFTYAP